MKKLFYILKVLFFTLGVILLYTSVISSIGYFIYLLIKTNLPFITALLKAILLLISMFGSGLLSIFVSAIFSVYAKK